MAECKIYLFRMKICPALQTGLGCMTSPKISSLRRGLWCVMRRVGCIKTVSHFWSPLRQRFIVMDIPEAPRTCQWRSPLAHLSCWSTILGLTTTSPTSSAMTTLFSHCLAAPTHRPTHRINLNFFRVPLYMKIAMAVGSAQRAGTPNSPNVF